LSRRLFLTNIGSSRLNHVIQAVRDGQSRRAPIERVASLLTGYFVPVATLLAIVTWLVWLTLGLLGALPNDYLDIKIGGWREFPRIPSAPIDISLRFHLAVWSLQFSIAVFVVACPCGIGLAAPTALLVGSGLAARFGILARGGGEAFQEMAQVDIVAFDKTGTLTHGGEPRVSDAKILSLGDDDSDTAWNPRLVLGMAAEMESASAHPLAIAIRSYCAKQGTVPANGSDFEEVPGRGLKATFTTQKCSAVIGNEAWMLEHSVSLSKGISARLDMWKSEAKSVVLLAISRRGQSAGYKLAAVFAVTDPLRSEARGVIAALHRASIETWMISGDNATTAAAVARMVGIPPANVIAGVLPSEKVVFFLYRGPLSRTALTYLIRTGCEGSVAPEGRDQTSAVQIALAVQDSNAQRAVHRCHGGRRYQRCSSMFCAQICVSDDTILIIPSKALTASDIGIAIGSGSKALITCFRLLRTLMNPQFR
jgi:Cu+-exporting ATPase